jgi:hypothetical protein
MKNPTSDLWDEYKTLRQNYRQIDIGLDLNQQPELLDDVDTSNQPNFAKDVRFFRERGPNFLKEKTGSTELQAQIISMGFVESQKKVKRKPKINRDEGMVVKKLMKKYGKDFGKMRRDIKVNVYQWTERQCEKKFEAFEARFPDGVIDWNRT